MLVLDLDVRIEFEFLGGVGAEICTRCCAGWGVRFPRGFYVWGDEEYGLGDNLEYK